MKESMNIFAAPGTRVRFSFPDNGYEPDMQLAGKHLTVGAEYTVAGTEVGSWSTAVSLAEVPGLRFNSVMFAEAGNAAQSL